MARTLLGQRDRTTTSQRAGSSRATSGLVRRSRNAGSLARAQPARRDPGCARSARRTETGPSCQVVSRTPPRTGSAARRGGSRARTRQRDPELCRGWRDDGQRRPGPDRTAARSPAVCPGPYCPPSTHRAPRGYPRELGVSLDLVIAQRGVQRRQRAPPKLGRRGQPLGELDPRAPLRRPRPRVGQRGDRRRGTRRQLQALSRQNSPVGVTRSSSGSAAHRRGPCARSAAGGARRRAVPPA